MIWLRLSHFVSTERVGTIPERLGHDLFSLRPRGPEQVTTIAQSHLEREGKREKSNRESNPHIDAKAI